MEVEFRGIAFERVPLERELPFRCFFNSIGYVGSHWHGELEIILQVQGTIIISTPDGPTVLRPGELYLSNPFETHSLISQTDHNLELALQVDLADPFLFPRQTGGLRFLHSDLWSAKTQASIRRNIETIAGELAERRDGYPLACLAAIADLLVQLVRDASVQDSDLPSHQEYPAWLDHVTAVIAFLRDRFDQPVLLDEVADHVGLSRFYVSHLVKAATGVSLQENLALIRANRAIHLMFTTGAKLVDIAMDSGFSHLRYFNKYFRRLYGEMPSAVRNRSDWRTAIARGARDRVRAPTPELMDQLRYRREPNTAVV